MAGTRGGWPSDAGWPSSRGGPARRQPAQRRPAQRTTGYPRQRAGRQPVRRGLSRRAKAGYVMLTVLAATVLAVSLTAYAVYLHLDGNIGVTNAFAGLRHQPRQQRGVINLLVLGSQTRNGQGPGFGYDPNTDLSDNLLLVHINAAHTHVTVVSIPRDTMVYEPACKARDGHGMVPAQPQAIIDGAMNLGGPPCAVATVEHLTGVRVDHFIEFDFNSFRAMVDTLGGVEVCVPKGGYHDPYSRLNISGGKHLITGNQALAFVRTRHGVGDGSDLGRIELQQEFIASLVQKIESQGTLGDPARLLRIADEATSALTVDPGLDSVSKLLGLAESLRHVRTKDVQFITMPTVEDPADTNRLLPEQPQDDILWHLVRADQLWHGRLPRTQASKTDVTVLNGTGIDGLAAKTAAQLKALGLHVTRVGNAPATASTTVTYAGSTGASQAYTLLGALNQAPLVQSNGSGPVQLVIGSDFDGVRAPSRHHKHGSIGAPVSSPDATQSGVQTRSASANICSGMPAANYDPGTPP